MSLYDPEEALEWDGVYNRDGADTLIWSGRPNGTLVAEVAHLTPGTALDVGCGEGADAIWLAHQGWQVTALDPSRVAIDRAIAAARREGVTVAWMQAGLLGLPPGMGPHDLVTAQYPGLRLTDDEAAINALLDAVAPEGTLLIVHHDMGHRPGEAHGEHQGDAHGEAGGDDHGFDPADFVMPPDVAARLDAGWVIEINETRDRTGEPATAALHVRDVVLRARRLP